MQKVKVTVVVPDTDTDGIYERLCDFKVYPEFCSAVRDVRVTNVSDTETRSDWEVNFNTGILRWSEHDTFFPDQKEIRFEQTAGDIDHFSGIWRVLPCEAGTEIAFDANFDLGLPMLADMLNPIAEKSIRENIQSMIHGLFLQSEAI